MLTDVYTASLRFSPIIQRSLRKQWSHMSTLTLYAGTITEKYTLLTTITRLTTIRNDEVSDVVLNQTTAAPLIIDSAVKLITLALCRHVNKHCT